MKLLTVMLAVAFGIYMLGALSAATFDLKFWPEGTREATACAIAFALGVIGIAGFLEQSPKRYK